MRVATLIAALVAAALLVAAAIAAAQAGTGGSGRAEGQAAILPEGNFGVASADSGGSGQGGASLGSLVPPGGGSIGGVQLSLSASGDGPRGSASGTVSASGLSLLDGRVWIGSIQVSASVSAGPDGSRAVIDGASVSGLTVDGQAVAAGPGSRVPVPGIGTLVFVESSASAEALEVNALRVEVTDPQAAAVIGSPFVIGHLRLSAVPGEEAPAPTAPRAALPGPDGPPAPQRPGANPSNEVDKSAQKRQRPTVPPSTRASPPGAPSPGKQPALPRQSAPLAPLLSGAGYVFPVFGQVSFSDDYGAPRASTGWHHGNDVFAATGTPVLAVADGTLSKVGVNPLGGYRLWLTDAAGNAFYYAHLSAYAPAAVEGAQVRAGQVIAFVGNTGEAITTPPHLHFEVHPGGEAEPSINPYPYLVAWQAAGQSAQEELGIAGAIGAGGSAGAPAAGAVLVEGTPELDVAPAPPDGLATPAS